MPIDGQQDAAKEHGDPEDGKEAEEDHQQAAATEQQDRNDPAGTGTGYAPHDCCGDNQHEEHGQQPSEASQPVAQFSFHGASGDFHFTAWRGEVEHVPSFGLGQFKVEAGQSDAALRDDFGTCGDGLLSPVRSQRLALPIAVAVHGFVLSFLLQVQLLDLIVIGPIQFGFGAQFQPATAA